MEGVREEEGEDMWIDIGEEEEMCMYKSYGKWTLLAC